MNTSFVIKDAKLVTPKGIFPGDLRVDNGNIIELSGNIDAGNLACYQAAGAYLLPGFVDIHNHGAAGWDFSFGTYDQQTGEFKKDKTSFFAGLENALQQYLNSGCTSVLLTTMAAPLEGLLESIEYLNGFLDENPEYENLVAGINIEGTFLKDPQFAGAQNPDYFLELKSETIEALIDACQGRLRIMNIPPEQGPAALPLIENLVDRNITVAGGHTGSYADQFVDAVSAGLSLAVHFLNGPSRSSTKSFQGGGAEEAILRSDDVLVEIIADGYHVGRDHVRDIIARKEDSRVVIITDSMFATGLNDLRSFTLLGLHGEVSDNREYLRQVGKDSLFGSVLTMQKAFENTVSWLTIEMTGVWQRQHDQVDLESAICIASKMCSANPSGMIRGQEKLHGQLIPGDQANLILASIDKQDESVQMDIKQVWLGGREVS